MKSIHISLLFTLFTLVTQAQTISLVQFSSGYSSPLGVENCGDSRLFIVQKTGIISICDTLGVKNPTPFLDVTSLISTGSERGLLGLAFHPNYASNGYFFINYTASGTGNTVIARYKVKPDNPNQADPASATILFTIAQPYSNHNGGCLRFGADGYLYIGTGDGGSGGDPGNRAQNPLEKLGKMLRIDVDNGNPYGIPPSNPFANSPDTLHEIWAIGMRNPWRFSFDRLKHDLWIGDVGQDTYEEIDFEPYGDPGGNDYGWRCYEANSSYNQSGGCGNMSDFTFPIFNYSHSLGCSITGGFMYRGAQYHDLFGKYIFCDYCTGRFWKILHNADGTFTGSVLTTFTPYRFVSFGEDRYGELYLTGIDDGKIYKLAENNCQPAAYINANDTVQLCTGSSVDLNAIFGTGLTYQWKKDTVDIDGATNPTLQVTSPGVYTVQVTKSASCTALSAPVVVVEVPVPTPVITGQVNTCANQTYTYQVDAIAGATYHWTVTGGTILSGQGTAVITVKWDNNTVGSISITQINP